MTEINDDQILELAQQIKADRGCTLTDAMIIAEEQLAPKPTVPTSFDVKIPVKARVARWILQEFAATKTHTLEERLGAYLETHLNRARITATRFAQEAPEIQEGGAVTMTRGQFQEKAPKA